MPEDVITILDKWEPILDNRFNAFEFVILDDRGKKFIVTCWATVDLIANGFGNLGFFSQENYRQRGLSTIVVAATLEYGFTKGVKQVN